MITTEQITDSKQPQEPMYVDMDNLFDSWQNTEQVLDFNIYNFLLSASPEAVEAFYQVYRYLSGHARITLEGFAKAVNADRNRRIKSICGLEERAYEILKTHFAEYHDAEGNAINKDMVMPYLRMARRWFFEKLNVFFLHKVPQN